MLFYKVESLLLFSKQLHLAGNRARAGEPARARASELHTMKYATELIICDSLPYHQPYTIAGAINLVFIVYPQ
jgi:hypothetical protein